MRRPCTFLLLALASATLFAESSNIQTADWRSVKALRQGQEVRVSLVAGGTYEGALEDVNDETLTITHAPVLNRETVRQIWVKGPGHRGKHVLIGASAGLVGLGLGAAIDNDCSKNSIVCTGNRGKIIGTALFGAVGAGIGAALPAHHWEGIYRNK
jgi:hypothetical protein